MVTLTSTSLPRPAVPATASATAAAPRGANAAAEVLRECSDPQTHPAFRTLIGHVLDVLEDAVRSPGAVADARQDLPETVHRAIRSLVARQVPLSQLVRVFWMSHTRLVDAVMASVDGVFDVQEHLDRSREVSQRVLAVAHLLSAEILRLYQTEQRRLADTAPADVRGVVRAVLGNDDISPDEASRQLGIDLSHHHLALVIWSERPGVLTTRQLSGFAAAIARLVGGRRPLIVLDELSRAWMWTGWERFDGRAWTAAVRDRFVPPAGLRACAGPVLQGIEGFRETHAAAVAAAGFAGRILELEGQWLCSYAEVAPLLLLTRDPKAARAFVDSTLGRLAAADVWSRELRETLRVYLSLGHSRAGAAERLHVARNTVAYRVERARELLGRDIDVDSLSVRLALEVARHLLPREAARAS